MRIMKITAASAALLAIGFSLPAFGSITISTDPTQFMKCTKKGICKAKADDAVLNVSDLQTMLATSNVTVTTNKKSKDRKKKIEDIDLNAPLSWGSGKTLSLDSGNSIRIAQPVSVSNSGGLSLTTNDGGTNGTLAIAPTAQVTFSNTNSSLMIDGASYTLEATLPQLATAITANPSGHFALSTNYNALADGTYAHSPIPNLSGGFEGLGNTISNLSITSKDASVGMFATVDGTVQDIHIANAQVSGTGKNQTIGALVGAINVNRSAGVIGASSSGAVTGSKSYAVGGLVGYDGELVLRSSSSAAVSDETAAPPGGVRALGGLVGYNQGDGDGIVASFATGSVTGGDDAVAGGLVGVSIAGIDQSYSTGQVTVGSGSGQCCDASAGGLAGGIGGGGIVSDVYATGAVRAGKDAAVGGLVGSNLLMRVFGGYSTGTVVSGDNSDIGGFFGQDQSTDDSKSACYWDMTTSGITDPSQGAGSIANDANVVGLTNKQLQKKLPKGFQKNIWGQNAEINSGLPYLLALPPQ